MTGNHHTEQPVDARAQYLTEREVAAEYRLTPWFLQKRRVIGGGPPFFKLGSRVLYARADVEAWISSRKRSSTSDFGGVR